MQADGSSHESGQHAHHKISSAELREYQPKSKEACCSSEQAPQRVAVDTGHAFHGVRPQPATTPAAMPWLKVNCPPLLPMRTTAAPSTFSGQSHALNSYVRGDVRYCALDYERYPKVQYRPSLLGPIAVEMRTQTGPRPDYRLLVRPLQHARTDFVMINSAPGVLCCGGDESQSKMFDSLREAFKGYSLANAFSGLGWTGFWAQIAIGSIPVTLAIYSFLFSGSTGAGTRSGLALVEYLTIAGLLLMAFTTFWFYRYTRLAKQIADPELRPPEIVVRRAAWTGVAASTLGIVLSILVMLFEVTQLLFYFLRAPQVGIPTVQTTGSGSASWISAADIVSLLILILTLFVEVAVLTFSLWLLFRTMIGSVEYPHTGTKQ